MICGIINLMIAKRVFFSNAVPQIQGNNRNHNQAVSAA